MAMTWGRDETGMVVIPGGGKAKQVKPAKPAKVAKTKPSAPIARIPEDDIPRYAPPVGLPITAGAPSVWPTATAMRPAAKEPGGGVMRVLRFLGSTILVLGIAAGGFAVGALTELGTEAEHYVLGLTSSPPSADRPAAPAPVAATDARVAELEAELAAARAELAAKAAVAAPTPATAEDDAARDDDAPHEHSRHSKSRHRKHHH